MRGYELNQKSTVDKILKITFCFAALFFLGCSQKKPDIVAVPLNNVYQPLPENLTAYNSDSTITARYTDPTLRYDHGILGDKIEAGGLLVIKEKKEYYYKLDTAYVFEDLQPRLKDVDNDGQLEIITIQTSLIFGASVCVYKITDDKLQPYAQSTYIGATHRWLNIAAIDDLDNDGRVEIAWIETPHIGGVLKIARLDHGSLRLQDEKEGVSNHQYGSRNLCLSVITSSNGIKSLYVPDNPHNAIICFSFQDGHLLAKDTLLFNVDPAIPLFMQYDFPGMQEDENCIYVPDGKQRTSSL